MSWIFLNSGLYGETTFSSNDWSARISTTEKSQVPDLKFVPDLTAAEW